MRADEPAVNRDWPLLAKLLFSFVHLADKVDEHLTRLRHTLFRPVGELKLPDRARLSVLQTFTASDSQGTESKRGRRS